MKEREQMMAHGKKAEAKDLALQQIGANRVIGMIWSVFEKGKR
jgi:VanZ family protein